MSRRAYTQLLLKICRTFLTHPKPCLRRLWVSKKLDISSTRDVEQDMHTHTHIYIYICIYISHRAYTQRLLKTCRICLTPKAVLKTALGVKKVRHIFEQRRRTRYAHIHHIVHIPNSCRRYVETVLGVKKVGHIFNRRCRTRYACIYIHTHHIVHIPNSC